MTLQCFNRINYDLKIIWFPLLSRTKIKKVNLKVVNTISLVIKSLENYLNNNYPVF